MASPSIIVILAPQPAAHAHETAGVVGEYRAKYTGAKVELLEPTDEYYLKTGVSPSDLVILHIFGQQAAAQACGMLRQHYARFGQPMNVTSVVFDEAPAMLYRSVEILSSARSWILSWVGWPLDEPPYEGCTWVRQDLNDPLLLPESTNRKFVTRTAGRAIDEEACRPWKRAESWTRRICKQSYWCPS